MGWRTGACLAATLAVVLVTGPAFGEEKLRLSWSAPPGCPSAEDVRAATLRGVGSQDTHPDVLEADARVEQVPTADGAGWRVHLLTRRGASTGERAIDAATCDGVAEATAVVLALALVPPASTPEPDAPGAPEPRAAPRDAPQPARDATREPHFLALGASVTADASSLPSAAAGGSVTLAWTPGRLRIEADARRWASQSGALATAATTGARFSMTSLGARGCWAILRAGAFEASPCAGADAHLVSAEGFGADANFTASGRWAALSGSALGRVTLTSWLAARARVEGFVPLARPTFVVENGGPVHRPPVLGVAAALGVETLFP